MRHFFRLLAGTALLLAGTATAQAQAVNTPADGRWGLVVLFGGTLGASTASDVEHAMIQGGFDDDAECWFFCTGTTPHPFTRPDGASRLYEASYRPWPRVEVAVTLARTPIAWTSGYRAGSSALGSDYLFLHYGVTTIAATPVLIVGPLRLQVGPALHGVETWVDDVGRESQQQRSRRLGVMAGAGVSLRVFPGFHLEARGQYRHVGRATVGPVSADNATLYAFQADFSHLFLGFGIGIRF